MGKAKKFKQIEPENFLTFECPSCNGHFGMDVRKVECMEANIRFTCPYCAEDHGVE